MEENILTFKVMDENGKEIDCEELYSFKNEENGKNYLVYTDNTFDEDGNQKVYAAIFNPDDETKKLIPIVNDDEWAFVEETIELLEEGNDL